LRESLLNSDKFCHLLDAAARAGEPILLLVNDPHRSTQTRPVLSALASLTVGSGTQTHALGSVLRFRALIATGTHRFTSAERSAFERATFADCGLKIEDVAWHDASDARSLAQVASVRTNRWVAESRVLLPIGSVEPHYFAGLTGPHKTVTIGCMSLQDIERNHAGALHPSSDVLRLQGNPVFDDIVRILRGLEAEGKMVCAVGQVVRGDALLAAATGDAIEIIDALLDTVRHVYIRHVTTPADVLHLRVPLPLGRNLYQADKALKNNHLAVRDGGGIILEADCHEGIGPDAFLTLLRRCHDHATACRIVATEGYRLGDHKAVKLRHLMDPACRGVRVAVVSRHLSGSGLRDTGIALFSEPEAALNWLSGQVAAPITRGLIVDDAAMTAVMA
jgi:nickel-dependent lactate racemase